MKLFSRIAARNLRYTFNNRFRRPPSIGSDLSRLISPAITPTTAYIQFRQNYQSLQSMLLLHERRLSELEAMVKKNHLDNEAKLKKHQDEMEEKLKVSVSDRVKEAFVTYLYRTAMEQLMKFILPPAVMFVICYLAVDSVLVSLLDIKDLNEESRESIKKLLEMYKQWQEAVKALSKRDSET